MTKKIPPWYSAENQDALYYLLVAIFFVELIVGGIAFFYGIVHAVPEKAGGPPIAQFPWLFWALASILAPVGLLLVFHLAATILSKDAKTGDMEHVPESMKRFYATVRHAPALVILLAILIFGALLFFVDGALAVVLELGKNALPYLPWILGSICFFLTMWLVVHAVFAYRQKKMEYEYAWRREVLQKTGIVLTDRASVHIGQGQVIDVKSLTDGSPESLPAAQNDDS